MSSILRSLILGMALGGGAGLPALAQMAPTALSTDDADPLAPKQVETAAPQAPGAKAPLAKPAAGAQPHPAIAIVLAKLGDTGPFEGAARDDREALASFYSERPGALIWTTATGPSAMAKLVLAELQAAATFGLSGKDNYAVMMPPDFASAEAQAEHEVSMSLAAMTYARHARGGRVDPTQVSKMIDMKPRPYDAKSVILALAAADDPAATLRSFHPQHERFKRLQKALVSARETGAAAGEIQRIEVNLERWRWMPEDLGAFHIENNIPEQLTRVFENEKVVLTEKIVVGKTSSPTPLMSADMQFVIFHPSWGVPSGIKTNELGPMLKRASQRNQEFFADGNNVTRALGRHQLKVSLNGRDVNPDSVDWSRVDVRQFHFTQPPSAQNVLGVVKFRFPNKYDVYMHDTTERHLFNSGVRAFSHGCMRVQNPIRLAEAILGRDKGWSADKVRSFVPGGRTSDITLEKPVPVHLTYFTATVDDAGVLHTHGDLYGMDSRVASALAGKAVSIASVKPEASGAVATAPPKREHIARASRQPVEKPWNPFRDW